MGAEQQVVYGVTEAGAKRPSTPTDTSAPLQLTSERLRVWGARAAFSLVDQGLFSGAGFLVNLLLARWLAPDSYGAFAVAFAAFLFIAGFHNVLLLEPLTVMGPGRHSENLPAYFRAQFQIHFLLVGCLVAAGLLACVAIWRATPDSPLVGAIFGGALMLPLLLLLWLVRRMCYVLQSPGLAVAGTASYLVLIVAGLAGLRHFSLATPFLSFLLMGGASLVASVVLLARIGFFRGPKVPSNISWRSALRENWTYGRWLVGSTTLYSISNQTQTYIVAGTLGLGAAGTLRAMQLPSLVMTQVVVATSLLVLPILAREYGNCRIDRLRQTAYMVSLVLTLGTVIFAGFLFVFDKPVAHLLFGNRFPGYEKLMCLTAIVPVCTGFGSGFTLAFRAMQRPKWDLIINSVVAPIGILSALALIAWWGIWGAGLSLVLVSAAVAAGSLICLRLQLRDWFTSERGASNGQH